MEELTTAGAHKNLREERKMLVKKRGAAYKNLGSGVYTLDVVAVQMLVAHLDKGL